MQRKFLEGLGLEKEVIDRIMDANGSDVERMKGERDEYKRQLIEAQTTLKSFEGVDVKELQDRIAKLTDDLKTKDADYQQKLADRDFADILRDEIIASGAKNAKAVMALLDQDMLKASKNQKEDIQKALETVKQENDYLFQGTKPVPRVVSTTSGPSPATEDKKTQANEALRSLFGRGE